MGKHAKQYFGGIIGADPLVSSTPRTSGVFALGALGGDGAAATRPTRRWGGITGRSLVESGAGTPAFKAVAYTGAGGTPSITGVGFQPDFVWIKNRDQGDTHVITDVVRGVGKTLTSETTAVEATDTDTVTSFDTDGFSLGADVKVNTNTEDYVAWCFKAGGAGVSNTDGSITSTVSANVEAGFSIVTYTGTGATATIGHGLNSAPEFVIAKQLDQETNNWDCFHVGLDATNPAHKHIYLNSPNGVSDNINRWNDTLPSSSVVTLGNGFTVNRSARDYIMYCFHSVPGLSKFGSYSGSGSAGNKVTTGFQPAFVMIKRKDTTGDWVIVDNARNVTNPRNRRLFPNANYTESTTSNTMDFDADGFTLTVGDGYANATGGTYIYLAFAENIPGADTLPTTGVLGLAEDYQGKL